MGRFDYHKACNLIEHLPKHLKHMGFYVECIPDIHDVHKKEKIKGEYIPCDNITRWIERFGECEDIADEAKQREKELSNQLSNIDKEISDILHEIEFKDKFDLFWGWKASKKIQSKRKERREIKDEMNIINNILSKNISNISRKNIKKIVSNLSKRSYSYRVMEDEI